MSIKNIKNDIVMLAHRSMANGFFNTMKNEFANTEGRVNMARLGTEAVGILVLVVIWTLIPQIGNAVTTGMPAIPAGSGWAGAANGSSLWLSAEPMLRVAVIVLVAALILAVIMELRQAKSTD